MAKNQLREELLLVTTHFDKNIDKVMKRINQLETKSNSFGKGFGSSMGKMASKALGFNTSMSGVLGVVGKFAPQLAIATTAIGAFQQILAHNDVLNDAFHSTLDQCTASLDTFWNALATGDFSNFNENLENAAKYAKEAYEALDEYDTIMSMSFFKRTNVSTEYEKELTLARDRNLSEKERLKHLAAAKKLMLDQVKLMRLQAKLAAQVSMSKFKTILSENGLGNLANNEKVLEWYMNNWDEIKRRSNEYQLKSQNPTTNSPTPFANMSEAYRWYHQGDIWAQSKEGRRGERAYRYTQIFEKGGEDVEAIKQYYQTAKETDKLIAEMQKDVDNVYKRITSGDGGGGGKKYGSGLLGKAEKAVADLKKQLSNAKTPQEIAKITGELTAAERVLKSLKEGWEVGSPAEYSSAINDLSTQLDKIADPKKRTEIEDKISTLEEMRDKLKYGDGTEGFYEKQLSKISEKLKKTADPTIRAELKEQKRAVEDLMNALKFPKGSIGAVAYEISKVNEELQETVDEAKKIELLTKNQELQAKNNILNTIAGSVGRLSAEIADLNAQILLATSQGKVDELNEKIKKKQEEYDKLTRKGIYSKDKAEKYSAYEQKVNEIKTKYTIGAIDYNSAKEEIAKINKELAKEGLEPIKIHIETDFEKQLSKIRETSSSFVDGFNGIDNLVNSFSTLSEKIREGANAWEVFMGVINAAQTTLDTISSVIKLVTFLTDSFSTSNTAAAAATQQAAAAETEKMGTDIAAAATAEVAAVGFKAQEQAQLNLASSSIFAAHANIPFAGVPIAQGYVNQMMAAMQVVHGISAGLTAFANGGIVGGSSFSGDRLYARVNSGEMILNGLQQKRLFDLLDGKGGFGSSAGQVEFKIKGSDLYGTMKNYSSVKSKTSNVTRFK